MNVRYSTLRVHPTFQLSMNIPTHPKYPHSLHHTSPTANVLSCIDSLAPNALLPPPSPPCLAHPSLALAAVLAFVECLHPVPRVSALKHSSGRRTSANQFALVINIEHWPEWKGPRRRHRMQPQILRTTIGTAGCTGTQYPRLT